MQGVFKPEVRWPLIQPNPLLSLHLNVLEWVRTLARAIDVVRGLQPGKIDKRHGDPDADGKNSGQKAVRVLLYLHHQLQLHCHR